MKLSTRMASLIALMTDFGHKDPFAGVMKGIILSINPSAEIADICNTRAEVVRARLSEAKRGVKAAQPRKTGTGKAK